MIVRIAPLAATLLGMAAAAAAQNADEGPLSSIGWLSDSIAEAAALRPDGRAGASPRRRGAIVPDVTVTPLDDPAPDGVGLLGPDRTGLPPTLWGASTTDAIAARLAGLPARPLPAARDRLKTILLARLDPPRGGGTPGALALARIDTLLRWGMLDSAAKLIETAGDDRPALFRRAFDVALLQDRENDGCAVLRTAPGIAPSIPARIFCLARSGDWSAAALTLETAEALDQLSPEEDALLARFLDPELAEAGAPLPVRDGVTPLEWRMLEAIGERVPTGGLPLAFAHGDLRPTAGWKRRIEAGERLARTGGLSPTRLGALYREREPAASGGVWDRAAAVQRLDAALDRGRPGATGRALEEAWRTMRAADLGLPFAALYAPRLAGIDLEGGAERLAHRIALLGPEYEAAALAAPSGADPVALAFARGLPVGDAPQGTLAAALAAASAEPPPALPDELRRLRDRDHLGEALIAALAIVADGPRADPADLTGALVFLRANGLEDTMRRASLQLYLLEAGA